MDMNHFGLKLEKLIRENKIKVSRLAKEIEVNPKTLAEWIGATARFPSNPQVIKKLSLFFKVSVHDLLFGGEDPIAGPNMVDLDQRAFTAIVNAGCYRINIERIDKKYQKDSELKEKDLVISRIVE